MYSFHNHLLYSCPDGYRRKLPSEIGLKSALDIDFRIIVPQFAQIVPENVEDRIDSQILGFCTYDSSLVPLLESPGIRVADDWENVGCDGNVPDLLQTRRLTEQDSQVPSYNYLSSRRFHIINGMDTELDIFRKHCLKYITSALQPKKLDLPGIITALREKQQEFPDSKVIVLAGACNYEYLKKVYGLDILSVPILHTNEWYSRMENYSVVILAAEEWSWNALVEYSYTYKRVHRGWNVITKSKTDFILKHNHPKGNIPAIVPGTNTSSIAPRFRGLL